MKNNFVLGGIVILLTLVLLKDSFAFGIKAGLNLGNLYGEDADNFENKFGPLFGVSIKYEFDNDWTIQPELLYTSKGGKFDDGDYEMTWSFAYIEIPVLSKYKFINNYGENDFNVYFGPSGAFRLSSRSKNIEQNGVVMPSENLDYISDMDICLIIGIDYFYNFEKFAFIWDVRYTGGLTSVDNSPEGRDMKTGTITLAAGLVF